MAVQVENVQQAKTGKSLRVQLGGQWYGAALDSGLADKRGQMIEAEIETGKYGPWIKGWKPVAATQVPPPQQGGFPPAPAPAVAAPHYAGEAGDNIMPWYWPSVSNICAEAIKAGLIKDPVAINQWALKMAQVAVSVKGEVR